ncbi:MAG: hypothetical protein ACOY3P_01145 [Planctomycetota bacterium]
MKLPTVSGGLTLVEVVAALVLSGSLLAACAVAFAAHHRQMALAERRLNAVQTADAMLALWYRDPEGVPQMAEGAVAGEPALYWRTRPIALSVIEGATTEVVRFELFGRTRSAETETLVRVDLLTPRKSP